MSTRPQKHQTNWDDAAERAAICHVISSIYFLQLPSPSAFLLKSQPFNPSTQIICIAKKKKKIKLLDAAFENVDTQAFYFIYKEKLIFLYEQQLVLRSINNNLNTLYFSQFLNKWERLSAAVCSYLARSNIYDVEWNSGKIQQSCSDFFKLPSSSVFLQLENTFLFHPNVPALIYVHIKIKILKATNASSINCSAVLADEKQYL